MDLGNRDSNSTTGINIVWLVVAGIGLIVGGILISLLTPSLFPVQASAESEQINQLFQVLLAIGGSIFLLVQGLLLYSVLRFRAKPDDTSDGPNIHGNTTLEIVWTAIPAVIVFVLTILSYNVWVSIQSEKPDEVVVEAVGARFNWAFTYTAAQSLISDDFDMTQVPADILADLEANGGMKITDAELHTYVGRPVKMEMVTRDVIHSFWVPAFRVKQDLLPGRTTEVRFTPIIAGEYPIRCAELCGANHGEMIGTVFVHEDEDAYNEWLRTKLEVAIVPPEDPALRGRAILESQIYPCQTCHILEDLGWTANVGPALNGVGDRAAGDRGAATGLTAAEYLLQSIHEPSAYLAPGFGNLMPNLSIPDVQANDIVAYLCTQTASGESACPELLPEPGA